MGEAGRGDLRQAMETCVTLERRDLRLLCMMAPLILFANRDNVLLFLNDKIIHCVVIGGKGNTRKLSYFMSKVHYLETDGEKRCRVSSQ